MFVKNPTPQQIAISKTLSLANTPSVSLSPEAEAAIAELKEKLGACEDYNDVVTLLKQSDKGTNKSLKPNGDRQTVLCVDRYKQLFTGYLKRIDPEFANVWNTSRGI